MNATSVAWLETPLGLKRSFADWHWHLVWQYRGHSVVYRLTQPNERALFLKLRPAAVYPSLSDEADLEALSGLIERVVGAEVEEIYLPLSRLINFHVQASQGLHAVTTQFLGRTLVRDVELHGEKLRAGQAVIFLYPSANRDPREFRDRLDRANLVVGVHHRHQRGLVGEGLAQDFRVDNPGLVDRQEGHIPASAGEDLDGVQDGFVLDARRNEVPPARRGQRFGHPSNCQIVAFGSAAREHHFSWLGADKLCNRCTGNVHRRFGLLTKVAHAGRITPVAGESLRHLVQHPN